MSSDLKPTYVASSDLTITLASLATDSGGTVGRESNEVDNTSNKYADFLISGKITTGTSPTDAKQIEVHVVGLLDDTHYPDVFDGTDSAETVTSVGIKNSICRPIAIIATNNTSDRPYPFGPVSVAGALGLQTAPKKFVVFVTHNTGVNLNSTAGNHQITISPQYLTAS